MYTGCLLLSFMLIISKTVHSFSTGMVKSNSFKSARSRLFSTARTTDVSYKVGFMFPGQGAQTVGMAASVCAEIPAAKELFTKASTILGYDLLEKPAIFVSSMAALEKLKVENPAAIASATVAMGLSLGEYSALCFADVFSFEDGVRLTKARGEAMQAAADSSESGMMSIVGLDIEGTNKICVAAAEQTGQSIEIANYLVNGNYAISGGKLACLKAKEIAPSMGARMAMPLAVAGAFHTKYMEPAVEKLRAALAKVEFKRPRIPVISNVDAKAHWDPEELKEILAKQVTYPVQWETIMTALLKSPEFEKAYEVGPGTVCKGIVKRFNKKLNVDCVSV